MRPLKASDAADKRWIVTEARPITWAMGPLAETSTAALPIVLFHQINVGAPAASCSPAIKTLSALVVVLDVPIRHNALLHASLPLGHTCPQRCR